VPSGEAEPQRVFLPPATPGNAGLAGAENTAGYDGAPVTTGVIGAALTFTVGKRLKTRWYSDGGALFSIG